MKWYGHWVNLVENFDETDPELAVDYWNDINSDPSIFYEDYVNVSQNVSVCGEMSDEDMIVQLKESKQKMFYAGKKRAKKCKRSLYQSRRSYGAYV